MSLTQPRHTKNRQQRLERGLPERRYVPELHGVRGLALAGVVLFHLFGNGRVSGGIDIFLAVSGFLFTGMLLREAAATGGRVDPLKYYGRLVRRILVPAALVVAATLVMGLIIPLHLFVGPSKLCLRFQKGLVAGSGMAVCPCHLWSGGVAARDPGRALTSNRDAAQTLV